MKSRRLHKSQLFNSLANWGKFRSMARLTPTILIFHLFPEMGKIDRPNLCHNLSFTEKI